jgi:hypothetical protein
LPDKLEYVVEVESKQDEKEAEDVHPYPPLFLELGNESHHHKCPQQEQANDKKSVRKGTETIERTKSHIVDNNANRHQAHDRYQCIGDPKAGLEYSADEKAGPLNHLPGDRLFDENQITGDRSRKPGHLHALKIELPA